MPTPNLQKFTDRAQTAMRLANQEAMLLNHEDIGTEHILLGLAKEGAGLASYVLNAFGLDLNSLREETRKLVQSGPDMLVGGQRPLSPRGQEAIELAWEEAKVLQHHSIGAEHLLLGILRVRDGLAAQALINAGNDLENVRHEVLKLLGHAQSPPEADSP